MKIVLVGNRHGNAVINWPGVLTASGIVATISLAIAAVFMLAFSWFSPFALVMSAFLIPAFVVGMGVQRALQLPTKQLKPLK